MDKTDDEMRNPSFKSGAATVDDVVIRAAVAEDVSDIADLDARSTGQLKRDYWQGLFDHISGHPATGRAFFVAESRGRLIGFICGEIRAFEFGSEPSGWVFALEVESSARVHSVGTRLFDFLADGFRRAGVNKVRTMLDRRNELVLAFFRGQGMMTGPFIQLEKDLE